MIALVVGLMAGGRWAGLFAASAAATVLLRDRATAPAPVEVSKPKRVKLARLHGPAWVTPCSYCGRPASDGWDHVVPLSRGGPNARWNMAEACVVCNSQKGDDTPEEWWDRIGAGRPFPPHWPRSAK